MKLNCIFFSIMTVTANFKCFHSFSCDFDKPLQLSLLLLLTLLILAKVSANRAILHVAANAIAVQIYLVLYCAIHY